MNWSRPAVLLLLPLFSCASAADVSQLGWQAGCWKYDQQPPGSGKYWTTPAAGSLLAVSRTVVAADKVMFEFLRIQDEAKSEMALYAQPSGKPPIRFLGKTIGKHSVTFENLEHDFPQRVIYRLLEENRLLGRIEGVIDGNEQAIGFPMTRIECASVSE